MVMDSKVMATESEILSKITMTAGSKITAMEGLNFLTMQGRIY
jgi:hypothetical protein